MSQLVAPINGFIELSAHLFLLIVEHLALSLQVLDLVTELEDVLLEVNFSI